MAWLCGRQFSRTCRRRIVLALFVHILFQTVRCNEDDIFGPTMLRNADEFTEHTTNELPIRQTNDGATNFSTLRPAGLAVTTGSDWYYLNHSRFNDTDPVTSSLEEQANTTDVPNAAETSSSEWQIVMNVAVICVASTSVVANTLTLVTLTINGQAFSKPTILLLRHQSLVDAVVSVCACGIFIQTSMWSLGVYYLDFVICYVWHSQHIYWIYVYLSIWNLVLIAVDRFLAVCYPIRYTMMSPRNVKIAIASLYMPCIISTVPCLIMVKFEDGRCVFGSYLSPVVTSNLNFWLSFYILLVSYICPNALFFGLYGRIILQMRRHCAAFTSDTTAQTITASTIRITKCAITLTAIFMATMCFHTIYYCIGSVGLVPYIFRGTLYFIGLLMTMFNSFANPFLYALFMPGFRRSIRRTLCGRSSDVQDVTTTTEQVEM